MAYAEARLTRAIRRGELDRPGVKVKNPQLYVHPRQSRDQQCGCGFPRSPCVIGRKWSEDETELEYKGNYCAAQDPD